MLLKNLGVDSEIHKEQLTIAAMDKQKVASLNAKLVEAGMEVYEISTLKNDLETIFIDLTKK